MCDARERGIPREFDGEVAIARALGQDLDHDQRLGHEQPLGHFDAADHHVGLGGGIGLDLNLRAGDKDLAAVAALGERRGERVVDAPLDARA
jgi:hypothetical protein